MRGADEGSDLTEDIPLVHVVGPVGVAAVVVHQQPDHVRGRGMGRVVI
jgi:hypothetical protein